jgi:hypothetical protein
MIWISIKIIILLHRNLYLNVLIICNELFMYVFTKLASAK